MSPCVCSHFYLVRFLTDKKKLSLETIDIQTCFFENITLFFVFVWYTNPYMTQSTETCGIY